MFSRKKKEEKKRKHKPGMTQDEINQLQEVGMRRGFWGARKPSTKRDKKPEISAPISLVSGGNSDTYSEGDMISITSSQGSPQLHHKTTSSKNSNQNGSHDEEFKSQRSVKEKAAMFGGGVYPSSHAQPMPVPASSIVTTQIPVPPVRKKSWKTSKVEAPVALVKPKTMPKPHVAPYHHPHAGGDFIQTNTKVVVLRKRQSGSFGFSLRRSSLLEQSAIHPNPAKKTIYFAEPGPHQDELEMPLNPGDRLLEIDGWTVDDRNRDEVVSRIKNTSNSVKLLVAPAPVIHEHIPLHATTTPNLPTSQVTNNKNTDVWKVRSLTSQQTAMQPKASEETEQQNELPSKATDVEERVFNEEDWDEHDAVWYIQESGFCAAHTLKSKKGENGLKDGQVWIKIDHSGDIAVVSEETLELINSENLDRSEDILSLRHLNECGVLHTLRQRFNGNLQYTYTGPYLLAVCSPQKPTQHSVKVMQMFKGCRRSDMPPHIFAASQVAFKELINTKTDQSLVMMGQSGSGKSQNVRHVLSYLAKVAGADNCHVTAEKLYSAANLLESLSNAGTSYCNTATRCVHMYSLDINKSAQITGASVQGMLLEKSRVSRRPRGEENFKIFYQLLEGASDSLKRELFLVPDEQYGNDMVSEPEQIRTESWRESARCGFKATEHAFDVLKFTADEIKTIYHVIAACMHLGMAGASRVSGAKYQFAHPDAAQKASSLLGISIENLSRMVFSSFSSHNLSPSMSPHQPNCGELAQDNLNAFIVGLYNEVFRITVSFINRELSSNLRAQNSLLVIDVPGTQYSDGRGLNDLVFNYTQERLQLLFNHEAFTRIKDRYLQEDVMCEMESQGGDPEQVSLAIDVPPSQQRSGKNLGNDRKGLMWLLDEEAMINGATEDSFIERLLMFFGQTNNGPAVISRSTLKNHFKINHFKGACSIEYNASNWLKLSRENQTERIAIEALQDSKKKYISAVFGGKVSGGLMQGSVVGLEGGGLMLRRAASMRKAWSGTGVANVKKKSLPLIKKLQVDSLIDAIRRTNAHFILCVKPYELTDMSNDRIVNVKALRQQLNCYQLLDAARNIKQGFVEHCVFSEFRQKFEVICRQMDLDGQSQSPQTSTGNFLSTMDDKEATEAILQETGLSKSQYKLGVSQVLLRFGTTAKLEDRRNDKVQNIISVFQARCRGYLARKMIQKRKIQTVAVRCIQRNVRNFIEVREWPWWRLLNKVLPLVTVRQTEEELREKEAELEIINARFTKVLSERDELKQLNAKYEAQMLDMSTDLSEEKASATNTSEMLEQETIDRMRLEKELAELQSLHSSLKQRFDVLEVEFAEQKLLHSADNEAADSSDEEIDASEYKMKYEREKREAKFQLKKTTQEYDEKLEMLEQDKKHVERKVHQMEDEVAEHERNANTQKKKAQRLLQELNDAKIFVEEMNVKNHELEKKQRKFDSELYSLQADLTETKSAKEKLQREKEKTSLEVYQQEQTIREKAESIELLESKVKNLEEEIEETTLRDNEDGQMLNSLKKQKRELEAKVKDQEEELDEQAGQLQMLHQSKERLEMNNERQRQQHTREIDSKDEELEEMRQSYHKKIKLLEAQVEEEEEERSKMMRAKRELEAQIQLLQDQQPTKQRDAESERKLRKDLKRYKALLADAQTMIDHLKADAVNKQQLRQLKAKFEESEYNCSIAVKGKKAIEIELEDIQAQLDEISKAKQEVEEKVSYLSRENHEMQSRMEEDEDDNKELARKYRQLVNQQSDDKKTLVQLNSQIDDLKREKEISNEKIQSLQNQLQYMEENTTDKSNMTRFETKCRDLEMKLDFEKTSSRRLEVHLTRAKEQVEKQKMETESLTSTEQRQRDQVKRLQKQIRDMQEEQSELVKREQDALQKKHELELQLEDSNNQHESSQADLKLAFKRISDLQAAFEDLEDSDLDDYSDNSESDDEEYSASGWRSRAGDRSISTSSYRSSVDDGSLFRNQRTFDDSDDERKSKTPEISDV